MTHIVYGQGEVSPIPGTRGGNVTSSPCDFMNLDPPSFIGSDPNEEL